MRILTIVLLSMLVGAWAPAYAQDTKSERVELRVSSKGPGSNITVDRGTRDQLEMGDVVLLYPREGGVHEGDIIQISDRSAVVELRDPTLDIDVGTRGEVFIPAERLVVTPVAPTQNPPAPVVDEALPWETEDENWVPGMPLLAEVKPVRPDQRAPRLTGRFYTIGNLTQTSIQDFDNSFLRVGTNFLYENPFGAGGELLFDGEFNYTTEFSDNSGADLLLQRFAYVSGGTRFDSTRWALGRFLQYGMPEFGVLDGVEWSHRTQGGSLLGASLGFMPELTDDFNTGDDSQFSAYYLWSLDDHQEFMIGAGYQKTAHNGDADRDLLVAKLRFVPPDSWYLNGTFWVDFYTDGDNVKGQGTELTQAVASLGRRWNSGNGVDLSYFRQRFPEIDRREFIPVLAADLADNRYDRLTLTAWGWMSETTRLKGWLGGWDDEEDSGGFAELALYSQDYFTEGDFVDLSVYGNRAQFSQGAGARITYGQIDESGRWSIMYELGENHHLNFPNDRDDVLQHRLRASRSFFTGDGWNLNFDAEATLWDEEWSWALGFYVQKSF